MLVSEPLHPKPAINKKTAPNSDRPFLPELTDAINGMVNPFMYARITHDRLVSKAHLLLYNLAALI